MPLCFYCKEHDSIENSHVISKFISDWVKETSPTGYLRSIGNPNKREQDGEKQPILCPDCEQDFGIFENIYKKNLFSAIANYRKPLPKVLNISEHDKKFMLSLVWRQLIRLLHFDLHDQIYPDELEFLEKKADLIKQYIDSSEFYENPDFSIYLIPLHEDQVKNLDLPLAATANFYEYERLIFGDLSILDDFKQVWIMVKLPFHIIVCDLMKNTREWGVPEILTNNELVISEIKSVPQMLKNELKKRVFTQAKEIYSSISDEQRAKIESDIKKNIAKTGKETGAQKSLTRSHVKGKH